MERWSVCIVEAWREYWRLRREWREAGYTPHGEPYVWLRASRLAPSWVPHVGVGLVDEQGRLVMRSFGPVDKRRLPWWRLWRVIVFRGRWQDGDAQPDRAGEP